MCSRHSDHRSTRSAGPRSHGIEINRHTVEFSSNRRPNHSSRNLRSDRLRPGVVRSCCVFLLSCFALDLSRSSAFPAISLALIKQSGLIAITGSGFFFESLPRRLGYSSMVCLDSHPPPCLTATLLTYAPRTRVSTRRLETVHWRGTRSVWHTSEARYQSELSTHHSED